MNIAVEQRGRAHMVNLSGRLTMESAAEVHEALAELLKNGGRSILLRLDGVTDFSSTGIAGLFKLQRLVTSAGGAFALLEPSPIVDYVLDLARMVDAFRIYRNEADALREFGGRTDVPPDVRRQTGAGGSGSGADRAGTSAVETEAASAVAQAAGTLAANVERAHDAQPLFDPLDTRL